jgi:hypothetical protein
MASLSRVGSALAHVLALKMSENTLPVTFQMVPGRPGRGFGGWSGRLAFSPRLGGSEELSGVLGGTPRRASSSAMRASSPALRSTNRRFCSTSPEISAISSCRLSEIKRLGSHPEFESAPQTGVNGAPAIP